MTPSRLSSHAVAQRETVQRGMAVAEALRRSATSCLSRSVIAVSRMGLFVGCHPRALLAELVNGSRANGRCVLVSRLSAVLKGITNNDISGGSISLAVAAAVTSPRPDCVTGYTSRAVELAQLGDAFVDELLTTMLLNHVQREAVVRGSSEGFWIWTTLSTNEGIPVAAVAPASEVSAVVLGLEERSALPKYLIDAGREQKES